MNAPLLAVSLGNSRTRVAAVLDGAFVAAAAVSNDAPEALAAAFIAALAALESHPEAPVVVASVCPDRVVAVVAQLRDLAPDREVLRIEEEIPVPIGRQLDPESIVGEDRLLNAAAAYGMFQQACVVVDAGTAMTVDFVDGAGTFHGGAILPGARTQLAALAARTAQLPEVELKKPQEPIGHNTQEAIRSGVFYGLRGAARELAEQYATQIGQFPLIVATGGDADLLFEDYDLIDRMVSDLTLRGVALAWQKAAQAEEDGEDDMDADARGESSDADDSGEDA